MFAKLKKKIQEEVGVGESVSFGSPNGPGVASPVRTETGPTSPTLGDRGSGYASSSEESTATSKEQVMALLLKRTEQCKKLESKICEYAAMIKDKNRSIEKLENSLEKQQDVSAKRFQELNEQYQASRVKLTDGLKEAMERREQEMLGTIETIEQEKLALKRKLEEAQEFRQKFYAREEENEEMQGLATQELAKVKHLLLNTQEELSKCKTELEEKTTEFEMSVIRVKNVEEELVISKSKLEEITKERDKFKEGIDAQGDTVQGLTTEKQMLQDKLSELSGELSEKSTRIMNLESSHTDLESRYQSLERNGDLHRNKTCKLLEEKDDHIDQLQERVTTLEQRAQDQNLSGDDRLTALEAERDAADKKLLEVRLQLTDIKTSWSDKITHLEDQISHLNSKIAEDNEELAHSHKAMDDMREKFHVQLDGLRGKVEDAEKRALESWELANQKDVQYEKERHSLDADMVKLRLSSTDNETQLRSKIDSLESQLLNLETAREHDKSTSAQRFDQMEAEQQELLEKNFESDKKVRRLEDECTQLKEKLVHKEGEFNGANECLEQKQGQINQLQNTESTLQHEISRMTEQLEFIQQEMKTLQNLLDTAIHEKDELMLRNAELSQQQEKLRQSMQEDKREVQEELDETAVTVTSLRDQLSQAEQKVLDYEEKFQKLTEAQSCSVSISELESHEQTIASLEDQVNDKNKTIKMQQQRLADLKKTLQRELKVQSLPNDEPIDTKDFAATPPMQRKNYFTPSKKPTSSLHLATISVPCVTTNNSVKSYQTFDPNVTWTDHEQRSVHEQLQDDVNFQYLKHVVLKFMLSREAEAIQLIKAVSVLLRFSGDEQKLIKETLEWKMSWFGARPPLGATGQKAKIIPPNY